MIEIDFVCVCASLIDDSVQISPNSWYTKQWGADNMQGYNSEQLSHAGVSWASSHCEMQVV